jgi:predicted component of type VI protein secretion system
LLLALSVISHQSHRLGPSSYRIFDEQGGTIGRGQNNEWVLDDPTCQLSSRHLNVRFGEGCFVVEDTSSNGTGLNGRDALLPRGQKVPIADGDRLFLADFEILVQVVENVAPSGSARDSVAADSAARRSAVMPDATVYGDAPETANGGAPAEFASILKIVTRGMIGLFNARQQLANRFRIRLDELASDRHNPLLSHDSAEAALEDLFGKNRAGVTDASEAFRRAFDILNQHQGAVLAGLLAAHHPRQSGEAFVRAYHEHIRQGSEANDNDATRFDNP